MGKLKDLTGQRFGKLVVLERAPNQGRYVCWKCKCDCGNEYITRAASLSSGRTRSCGCLYKETRPKPKNLLNQTFGKLKVIEATNIKNNDNRPLWKCQCACGNIKLVSSHDLVLGNTVSCGCKNKSAGESQIEVILQEHNISYLYNKAYFKDLMGNNGRELRYDFILFKNNEPIRLIEFDGEQHFKDIPIFKQSFQQRQIYEKQKNKYALTHNIPLVRIPYWELNNITLDMIMGDQYLIKE